MNGKSEDYIHSSGIKQSESLLSTARMELAGYYVHEIRQIQGGRYYMFSLIWKFKKSEPEGRENDC